MLLFWLKVDKSIESTVYSQVNDSCWILWFQLNNSAKTEAQLILKHIWCFIQKALSKKMNFNSNKCGFQSYRLKWNIIPKSFAWCSMPEISNVFTNIPNFEFICVFCVLRIQPSFRTSSTSNCSVHQNGTHFHLIKMLCTIIKFIKFQYFKLCRIK